MTKKATQTQPKKTQVPPIDAKQEEQIAKLKEELASEKAKTLRTLADLENFQRRESENKKNWVGTGIAQFLKILLPALLELQLGHAHTKDAEIKKVIEKLFATFGKAGLTSIAPKKNEQIDTALHEVLLTKEGKAGTVVEVLEPGWKFGEIVISPAKVAGSASKAQ